MMDRRYSAHRIRGCKTGRTTTTVQCVQFACRSFMIEKETIAPNACGEWFGHAQRGTCRNSGIHRVTAAPENLQRDRRGHGLTGGDHCPGRHNHRSAWILNVPHNTRLTNRIAAQLLLLQT